MIKAIIFDMGGVILDLSKKESLSIPKALSIMFEISLEKAEEIWSGYNRVKIITGKETPGEFLRRVSKIISSKKNIKTLLRKWRQLSLKDENCINWELLSFIKDLRKEFKVYIMSDTVNVAQNDELTKKVKSEFDGYFVSYEEGFKKPEKESFLNVLKKIGKKPEECIFIDDSVHNIKAAGKLGMKSIVFKSLNQLKKDLTELRVK